MSAWLVQIDGGKSVRRAISQTEYDLFLRESADDNPTGGQCVQSEQSQYSRAWFYRRYGIDQPEELAALRGEADGPVPAPLLPYKPAHQTKLLHALQQALLIVRDLFCQLRKFFEERSSNSKGKEAAK